MNVDKINISVIIPMYNAEKYIKKSIDSITNQNSHNFELEILVVDDYSTDSSCEIVKSLSDSRIKLIELEKNAGTANARNAGLKVARGEWIQFLDSDDTICNDLYQKFESTINKDFNCYIFSIIQEDYENKLLRKISGIKDKRAFGYFYVVWNKFIKKEICTNFKTEFRFEDVVFIFDMLDNNELRIGYIRDVHYLYNCKNNDSKMANFNKLEYIKMYSHIKNRIQKSDKLTKMFFLETFVGIAFSKEMPFFMSLKIALKSMGKFFTLIPDVVFNGIRNCIKNTVVTNT